MISPHLCFSLRFKSSFHPHTYAYHSRLSVLACSPQGALYYWVDVLRDTTVTCEGSVRVGESSAYSIASLPNGLGSVVSTNTAILHLVVPPSSKSLQVCLFSEECTEYHIGLISLLRFLPKDL